MQEDRPRLPFSRNGLKLARPAGGGPSAAPSVVTPDYGDELLAPARGAPAPRSTPPAPTAPSQQARAPFDAYGDRSGSRPFALRLPQPIDLVLRQIAAEHHTQPLRIVDQAIHDYLVKHGRLPATPDA